MTLANSLLSLATRIGTEFKTVRSEIDTTLTDYYTSAEVDSAIAAVIASSPAALDTLNELAAALGNDENFASTITTLIGTKADAVDVYTKTALDALLAGKAANATTLAGYNIADAYTKTEVDAIAGQIATQLARGADTVNTISSTDASVYTDSSVQPMEDPQNRSGWHFKNAVAGQKINWYTYSNAALASTHTRAALTSIWAVVTIYDVRSRPFINIYSNRLNDGQDVASWYRSRWVLDQYPSAPVAGTKYFVFFGADPGLYRDLPRLQITDTTDQFDRGPRNNAEVLSQMSWATNSAAQVNGENWTMHATGYTIAGEDVSSTFVHVGATQVALAAGLAPKANTADVYSRSATDSVVATAVGGVETKLGSGYETEDFVATFEAALAD